jgi:polar amino acid transport system substrate-binding protein
VGLWWGLVILLGFSISFKPFAAETIKLSACGHPFYPPVSWEEDGRLTGVAPAIVKQLLGELGVEVAVEVVGNWKRCLREAEKGAVDIVVAAYRIDERESSFVFSSEPVIDDPIALFINSNRSFEFSRWSDLKGKTVGLLLGDSFGDAFDSFMQQELIIEHVSEGAQNFGKLALGRIDFMPLGLHSGRLQSQQMGYGDLIQPLTQLVRTEYYYIAISRRSKAVRYLPQLNLGLKRLREQGELDHLIEHYSQDYLKNPSPKVTLP